MKIAAIKQWQWLLIALLVGPVLGYVHLVCRNLIGFPGRSLHQITFERMLSTRDAQGRPHLTNIVVHPHPEDLGSFVVTAEHADSAGKISQYWFEAITPYPTTPNTAKDRTVLAYLEQVRTRTPDLRYSMASWEHAHWLIAFYTIAAAVVIGAVWPWALKRGLLGTVDEMSAQFPLARSSASDSGSQEDRKNSSEVAAPIDEALDIPASSSGVTPVTKETATPAATRPLSAAPIEATATHRPTAQEFGADEDDYYPTERHRGHHEN